MASPLGTTLGFLVEKVGYPLASGVIRTVRVVLYGAAVWAVTYALANQDVVNVDQQYKFLAVALLMGVDKYLREHKNFDN
jgi:hypothetical protein